MQPYLEIRSLLIEFGWRSQDKIVLDLGWTLHPVMSLLTGNRRRHGDTQREGPCDNEGGSWSDGSTSQGAQRITGSPRSCEKGMEQILLWRSQKELILLTCGFQISGFQNYGRINLHSFKSPSLWYFVIVTWKTNTGRTENLSWLFFSWRERDWAWPDSCFPLGLRKYPPLSIPQMPFQICIHINNIG